MKKRHHPLVGALWLVVAGLSLGLVFQGAKPAGIEAAPPPRRAIVKLRTSLARQIEPALPHSLQLTATSAVPTGASSFLTRHSVRRLFPLHPQLVEAKRESGLSDRELALRVRERFR